MDPEIDVEQARAPIASRHAPSYGATSNAPQPGSKQTEGPQPEKKKDQHVDHTFWYSILRYHSHHWYSICYRWIIRVIVSVSVINFILEDTPFFEEHCKNYFFTFEASVSFVLLLEYALKIWTITQRKSFIRQYAEWAPNRARLDWAMSFESLIDVLSWLPFIVEVVLGVQPGKYEILQILRLVRLMKLPEFWSSFRLVARVLYYNKVILGQALLVCFFMILGCSILLYYTRPAYDPLDDFKSILACSYLSILMLTGQGIPNGTMPWYTRIIVSVTALFAIAQFAIPASMLTWGFENEAELNINRKFKKEKEQAQRVAEGKNAPLSSSSSDESDRKSEWEGYLEQLLGSDFEGSSSSDADADKEKEKEKTNAAPSSVDRGKMVLSMTRTAATNLTPEEMKRARRIFIKLDTDNDGFLDWTHFRTITESDQQAKDLMGQLSSFSNVTGDDKITLREFFIWLGQAKVSHKRYDDKVLQRLFERMEAQMAQQYSSAKARWKKLGQAGGAIRELGKLQAKAKATMGAQAAPKATVPAPVTPAATVPVVPKSTQLMQIAQNLCELEGVNTALREKVALLEKEIADRKAAKS